jgi:putative ABC transport system permease protein
MSGLERVYRQLLRLYPETFRAEYASDLEQALRDRLKERRHAGAIGRVRLVLFVSLDLLRSLPRAHVRSRRASVNEPSRRAGPGAWAADVRYALRGVGRRPGFAAAVVATLGLGTGAATTMFSVADGVALRPLPYPDAERLVVVGTRYDGGTRISSSNPQDFLDLQTATRTLEHVAASRLESLTLLGGGEPVRVEGAGVSPAYFDVIGTRPATGRAFTRAENARGGEAVAVISWGLWQRHFGGDRTVLGRPIEFDGRRFTVVGVMPREFRPPEAIYHDEVDVWFPLAFVSDDLEQRTSGFLQAIGRLVPGATVATASAELERISAGIAAEHPESAGRVWGIEPLHARTVGEIGSTLIVLLGAVGFVLLIACANVANLFLVRATERSREMALRTALGAGRGAIARLLFIEVVVLSVAVAVVALLLAYGGVAAFRATNPGDMPRLAEVAVDGRVLGFSLAVSLLTGLLFGFVPALGAGRGAQADRLREGAANLSASRAKTRLRGALIVAQTAIALVLLAGAGLLIHSFVNLTRVDPGFVTDGAVWMQLRVPGSSYETPASRHAFFTNVLSRIRALPGVEAAGGSENMPMGGNSSLTYVSPEGLELAPDENPPDIPFDRATDGFFEALGTPVLRGRGFDVTDDTGAEPVAMVNESLADRFWPGAEALGKRVKLGRPDGEGPWIRVVGVVADLHQRGLGETAEPMLYIPWRQSPRIGLAFIVRSRGDAGPLLSAMQEQVWAVDPTLPIAGSGRLDDHVSASIVEPRFYTLLLTVFAALALVLAFIGLYGTIAYTVEQRTREIGVRMALGAKPRDVVRLMIGRGMLLAGVGMAVGLAVALASTRLLGGFVFGLTPKDPATFAMTSLTLAAAALLACWLPARRASRLDPANTLRID